MVIRTLKATLINVMFISFLFSNDTIVSTPDQETDAVETKVIHCNTTELNNLIKKSSESLDQISSILEFIAQAINRGTIVLPNKVIAKKWIKTNLENVKTLDNSLNAFDIDIAHIYKINCCSKLLIAHIFSQLEQEFKSIQSFKIDPNAYTLKRSQLSKITPKITHGLINANLKTILTLQSKANEIGLTFSNKAARKLEQFNDKYQITKALSIIPLIILLGIPIMYYAPFRWFGLQINKDGSIQKANPSINWFTKIPFFNLLRNIKQHTGASKYTDRASFEILEKTGNGLLHMILSICDKDFGKISLAFSALAAYANKDSITKAFPQAEEFVSATRDFWQKLKGYEVKSNSKYQIIEGLTLNDERIIGLEDQIEELKKLLEYIANPEMYDNQQCSPGKAIAIFGPSGNGKTLLAKAVAGSLNQLFKDQGSNNRIAFKEIKWSEIVWTREGIKKIIQEAKAYAPCILFFDEFHLFPVQSKEGGPTLSDLLTELDGVNASGGQIYFMVASNQPQLIDSALLRSNRFGNIIYVTQPNFALRKKYFEIMCKRASIDINILDLDLIAKQTSYCSYSDLDTILKDARFTARREIRSTNQKYIQERIIKRIYRLTNKSSLSNFEKEHLAAKKAGAALMHLILDPQERLEIVTIKGRWKKIKESRYWDNDARKQIQSKKNIKYGALFTYNPNEELAIADDLEKTKLCKIKIAGDLAEEILLKSRSSRIGKSAKKTDKQKALELIQSTLYESFEEQYMPKQMKQKLNEKTYEIYENYKKEVEELLMQNYSLLQTIATELEEKELLTFADLQELMTDVQ